MRESKYTPGPWTTNYHYGLRIESEKEHGVVNDGWIIAKCAGPDKEANSKLMAAAPELLEALIKMVDCEVTIDFLAPNAFAYVSAIEQARKVIAKAKGDL